MGEMAKDLYKAAENVHLNADASADDDAPTKIIQALSFLERVATSEEAKEKACIDYYMNLLNKEQQEYSENDEILNIFKEIENAIQKTDVDELRKQQMLLIAKMSSLRTKPEIYKRRLEALKDLPNTLLEAQSFDYLVGNQSFFEEILNAKNKNRLAGELSNEIRDYIKSYTFSSRLNANQFNSLVVMVAADFRTFLEEHAKDLVIDDDTLKEFNAYKSEQERYFLNLLDRAENNLEHSYEQLLFTIEDIDKEMGFTQQTEIREQRDKLNKKIEDLKKDNIEKTKKGEKLIQNLKKQLDDLNSKINRGVQTENGFFRIHTNTSHGDVQEAVEETVYRALSVPGSAAVDIIGTITIDNRIDDIFPIFKQLSETMQSITKLHVTNRKDLKSYSDAYRENNKKMQKILNKYQEGKKGVTDYTKMFITNESEKLYWDAANSEHSFKGRTFKIADALAQLYSIEDSFMADQDLLIHIIINLSSATSGEKDDLEKYLSIFSGLLMFGDIYNMAIEAAQFAQNQLVSNDIHVIHLYNINGHFVPSSIVLKNIYNNFKKNLNTIDMSLAAKATVLPYSPKVTRKSYDWDKVSDTVLSNTKIKLHFLKDLFNFMREIELT